MKIQINLIISTPHGIYLDKKAEIVSFKTTEGYIGLMSGATEFMAAIVPSKILINHQNSAERQELYVDRGIAYFKNNVLSLIVNEIDSKPINEATYTKENEVKKYTIIEEIKIKKNIVLNSK
ncbi:F0F1 ATP synthase subunit epsilon [Metamycoplasma buccale]|uniref:F0F1 ATP synthase subunit epsilon n=1 Tax=Metamycoplasma buccale TaxID=55602 RepID=UPI00398F8B5D